MWCFAKLNLSNKRDNYGSGSRSHSDFFGKSSQNSRILVLILRENTTSVRCVYMLLKVVKGFMEVGVWDVLYTLIFFWRFLDLKKKSKAPKYALTGTVP